MVRDESLTIRFSELEMHEITRLAEQDARPKGAMVRKLVDEALAARRRTETEGEQR